MEDQLRCADVLRQSWTELQDYDHWRQVQDDMLLPRVRGVLAYLETSAELLIWKMDDEAVAAGQSSLRKWAQSAVCVQSTSTLRFV